MDLRTTQLLEALDPLSVELLAVLLEESLSEKNLLQRLPGTKQPNVHKKLARLARVGIIVQPRRDFAQGSPWRVTAPEVTAQFLRSLLTLSDVLDTEDRTERNALRRRLGNEAPGMILIAGGGGKEKGQREGG